MITHGRNSVNVSRKDLLKKLIENREIHRKDYAEAIIGYKIQLVQDLKDKLVEVEASTPENVGKVLQVSFQRPASHEAEYNEIIDMMEVSVDDVINLDATSFKQYFKNEWSWSNGFNLQVSNYKSISASAGTISASGVVSN